MLEIKNTRTEIKNALWTDQQTELCPLVEETHQQTVERIRTMKIGQKKPPELKYKQKKWLRKTEQSIQKLQDKFKRCDVCNWNTRRRKRKGAENIFEVIMAKYFKKLMTDTKPQIREVREQDKYKKKYTQIYHIQTEENQRQIETLEIKKKRERKNNLPIE